MIQNHVHLYLVTSVDAEANKFHIKQGTVDETPTVPVIIERALNGAFHMSTLLGSDGVPMVINDGNFLLANLSKAEVNTLTSLTGRLLYFINIDHADDGDSAGHVSDRQQVAIRIKQGSVQPIDPFEQYWVVGIEIYDARQV